MAAIPRPLASSTYFVILQYPSETGRAGPVGEQRHHRRGVAHAAPDISDAAFGQMEISISRGYGEPAGFMVGEDDYQCPGMCLGVIQGHTHGVVEIPYFGEHTRCVVGVAHLVDERTLHHQEKAFSAAVVRHYFEGLGRGLREVFRRTAFGDGGDAVVVARIECHGPAFGNVVEFFEASDHEAAPLFELPDDARITLLQILTARCRSARRCRCRAGRGPPACICGGPSNGRRMPRGWRGRLRR